MSDELQLNRYDPKGAGAIYAEMVQLFAEANRAFSHFPFFSVERFESNFVRQRARQGFELVAARIGGKLVGVIFGFTEIPGKQFGLCELMVAPAYQRRGIAKRLHDELLRHRPEQRTDLYVRKDNAPAQAAYKKWGWTKIGEVQPSPDAPVLDELVMGLPVAGESS